MPHSKGWERRRDRRTADPAPIGEIVGELLAEHAFARGLPVGRLASRWQEIVGERLARETRPTDLDHGILTVSAADSLWGAQARFLVEEIRRKANLALGSDTIGEVRIAIGPIEQNRR